MPPLWHAVYRESGGIGSGRGNPLEFHSSERAGNNGPGGRKASRKRSAKLGNEGSARRAGVKAARRKRPYLENSTACQKSTPNVDTPSACNSVGGRGSFGKKCCNILNAETLARTQCTGSAIPLTVVPLFRGCDRDIPRTFTESLILAQDERWRRA